MIGVRVRSSTLRVGAGMVALGAWLVFQAQEARIRRWRAEVVAAIRMSPPSEAQIDLGYDPDPQLAALRALDWQARRVLERDLDSRWRATPWLVLMSLVPQLGERLAERDANERFVRMRERERALYWLGRLGSTGSVARIGRLATDSEPRVRRRVVEALERIGVSSAPSLAALRVLAEDPVISIQFQARWTRWRLEPNRWEADLVAFLTAERDERRRRWIADWLADRGEAPGPVSDALVGWLEDQAWGSGREHTVAALWRLRHDDDWAQSQLLDLRAVLSNEEESPSSRRRIEERVRAAFSRGEGGENAWHRLWDPVRL